MGRHSGNNGVVKLGPTAVVALTGWDLDETAGTIDVTAIGDTSRRIVPDISEWKGSIKMNADHGADGQTLRAGDVVAFEGYTEGDASGKYFYSGSILITSNGVDAPFKGAVTRSYSFEGDGALSIAQVA
ncbi:hypothetical protein [Shimia sp.]|uniref:hypothetical protein n=1 Tax=Shimia sp. TaxID=1954381 RepID=UPI003B8EA01C